MELYSGTVRSKRCVWPDVVRDRADPWTRPRAHGTPVATVKREVSADGRLLTATVDAVLSSGEKGHDIEASTGHRVERSSLSGNF